MTVVSDSSTVFSFRTFVVFSPVLVFCPEPESDPALGFVCDIPGVASLVSTDFALTGVVEIVTNETSAFLTFFTGAFEFELLLPGEFKVHCATQVMLEVPTVTTTFTPVVTELQLHPPNVYPERENPLSVGVVKV